MSRPLKTLTTPEALLAHGLLPRAKVEPARTVAKRYSLAVTPAMAALIDPRDPDDPIAAQFLPDPRELVGAPGEHPDPIGDRAHMPVEGLVHRYPDRVLLKLVHVCPVYCRFCFRREMVGPVGDGALSGAALEAAFGYIAARPAIGEVILTGGDPFMVSARRAGEVTRRLASIDHVAVLRWHTRVPIVAPERITPAFVRALRADGLASYVAIHANHPREFTTEAKVALARLADAGISLVSQTVLLKGVNDRPDVMADLMRNFLAARIKPYYLHHADMAPGTSHFRTSIAEGRALMAALRGRLSGLAQPTYVIDIPGGVAKVPLGPGYERDGVIDDPWGGQHAYPPD